MSLHADLLAQAEHLAKKERRRPKQASLRRAVSAAYYALFHLLVDEATRRMVRRANGAPLRHALRRAFSHGTMKAASKGFHGGVPADPWKDALGGSPVSDDLRRVAGAFVDLQQARHDADYDLSRNFTRAECLDLVKASKKAFTSWGRVKDSLEADVFLAALLAAGNARK